MEAAVRIELTNTGFADPRLTTWLRRHETHTEERTRRMLERETGFEPATPTLARSCSTTELFPPDRQRNSGHSITAVAPPTSADAHHALPEPRGRILGRRRLMNTPRPSSHPV